MPGFLIEIKKSNINKNFNMKKNSGLIIDTIENNNYYIERRTINKFINDKVFFENEKYIIVTEGVILNSQALIKNYSVKDFKKTIIKMYEEDGETFFANFRGSFSGIFYDKRMDKWLIYTNHIGDKQVFFSNSNNGFVIASEINYITEYYKNNRLKYNLNKLGAYFLLTYGYMLEDHTLFKEIKKLTAGKYIKIENNKFSINTYYKFNYNPDYTLSENEIIEEIDRLFRKSVDLEFRKDKEYEYKHIVSLSGGLDSRMTTWVAHDLGYAKQLNYTFSQSDYLDEKIAKSIARDLKHEWLFKFLDNGQYLCDIESLIDINFGNCLYSGNAHVKDFIDIFNFKHYGILHTGQLGDAIFGGTYITHHKNNKIDFTKNGAYSNKLMNRIDSLNLEKYNNEEIFKLYNRGFNGILQGNLPPQKYTETISPYLDVDFLTFSLKIPLEYRKSHKIYRKWILMKYPKAADYKWESIQSKITDIKITILRREIALKRLPIIIFNKIFKISSLNTKHHMNPLDYWYKTNENLNKYIHDYYNSNIELAEKYGKLKKDMEMLFKTGNVIEKTQVLTLLGSLKKYFNDK